jgi:hypothetical protein
MKQKEVFKKIGGILQELGDQYEYLKTVPDDLNDLELELFVANAHFLTDHIEVLCKLNLQDRATKRPTEKPEKPAKPEKQETAYEQKYFEPMVQQMKHGAENGEEKKEKGTSKRAEAIEPEEVIDGKASGKPENNENKAVDLEVTDNNQEEHGLHEIDLAAETPSDSYSFIREEPETIRHELILDEAMDYDEDETLEVESEPIKETKKRRSNTPVVAEDPALETTTIKPDEIDAVAVTAVDEDEVLTINQKMSSQLGDKGIARTEQLSVKPISDIKLAITLNDKLLYVKDLFNGYNLAYSEAIEILNRFNTFEEATRFLKTNYVTKNNWEGKPATTEKFYALLKRRYA